MTAIASRRKFLGGAALALLAPSFARAQASSPVKRVAVQGVLRIKDRKATAAWFAEDGFVEGRDITLEYSDLEDLDAAETERRARAIVASRPDAILIPGDLVGLFKRLTSEIPIVFYAFGLDPVRMGFIESYPRPGGNVAGATLPDPESAALKSWELLRELRPKARRIGILYAESDVKESWMPLSREVFSAAASRLGLERVEIVVPTNAGFPPVERAIRAAKIDLLDAGIQCECPWIIPNLMPFLERSRIPAVWGSIGKVRRGGLLAAHPSYDEACREAVRIVARILRGANPATTPVYMGRHYFVGINLRTARAMGLTVPPSILVRANVVVK